MSVSKVEVSIHLCPGVAVLPSQMGPADIVPRMTPVDTGCAHQPAAHSVCMWTPHTSEGQKG